MLEIGLGARLIAIHTDGSCIGNPGRGGYAAILRWGVLGSGSEKELSGGFRRTTNNRMELMAAIVGLEALTEPCPVVTLYSDSRYVVDAVNRGWARKWRANGWMRNRRDKAINPDLWERLLSALEKQPGARLVWVRGHAGDPGNERADRLANAAARGARLADDTGYGG